MMNSGLSAILSSTCSDSHTWNLIYLEMLMQEYGYRVVNLGSCVPQQHMADAVLKNQPDMVVVSSINGSLYQDGIDLINKIKEKRLLSMSHYVIGGEISGPSLFKDFVMRKLLKSGYDDVFITKNSISHFKSLLVAMHEAQRTDLKCSLSS